MKINKIEAAILAQAVRFAKFEISEGMKSPGLFDALEALESKLKFESKDARRFKTDRVVFFDFSSVCKIFADAHIAKTTKSE